jgi:predicted ATPase
MYKQLIINDFRQFQDVDLYLGKRITVLAGRNSTGKSTILGILGNSGELKKKDGTTYSNGQFRAEFSEIFHGSKKYDASGSDRIRIDIVDNAGTIIDYRKFRTSWQNDNGKNRFRVIPLKITEEGKKTEAKMPIPVLYLGLSRLFPIGEADEDNITSNKIKFFDQNQKDWFLKKYTEILSIYDDIEEVNNFSIGETDKKNGVGVETKKYDYLTNSSGQDNLGQILMALLSFMRLRKEKADWIGGLLLIDEIDATLHPAAQKRLIDLLVKEAKILDIQVVVTTHSSDLLKHICSKTAYNKEEHNNDVELYYFSNANRHLEMKRNPEYSTIENDLLVVSMLQNSNKVKIYSEDAENRWFIKNLIPEYLPFVELLDVRIGCSQLLSLYQGDVTYFGNTLIVLDGDVEKKDIEAIPVKLRERLKNIILLPGDIRPEEVIYNYILSLDAEHSYWENAGKVDMNWTYFKENGPLSSNYSQEKDREKYKKWFVDHQAVFESTKLFEFWVNDNKELVEDFKKRFVESYNAVASRMFAIKIKDNE